MVRIFGFLIALTALLIDPSTSIGQTRDECTVMFQNFTREAVYVDRIDTLLADGTVKSLDRRDNKFPVPAASWEIFAEGNDYVQGRQATFAIRSMDGVSLRIKSTATMPIRMPHGSKELDFIFVRLEDTDFASSRIRDNNRRLTKGDASYRYWNAVHGIVLDETLDVIQTVGFLELSRIPAYFRTLANRIDDLDTTGIDDDAVAAAQSYSAVLREAVKVWNARGVSTVATVLAELYNMKTDTIGKVMNEDQAIAGKHEDLFQFLRSRRKALEKRYSQKYPHLLPPVMILLPPYVLGNGYYVNFVNTSGEKMSRVRVDYYAADGTSKTQWLNRHVEFNPYASPGIIAKISDFVTVTPSDAPWRVDADEWVKIGCNEWNYILPTNKLIRH